MNYIIKIDALTLKTLDRHILFLRNINIPYSVKLREKIIAEIDNLKIFPHSNPIYKKTNKTIYRKRTIDNVYNIIYSVKNNIIYVYYILDARQNLDVYFNFLK